MSALVHTAQGAEMEIPIGTIPACRHASMSHKIFVCRYPELFQHAAMPACLIKSPRVSKATPPDTNSRNHCSL
eukprot:7204911-Prymnesium_polylepis.1